MMRSSGEKSLLVDRRSGSRFPPGHDGCTKGCNGPKGKVECFNEEDTVGQGEGRDEIIDELTARGRC